MNTKTFAVAARSTNTNSFGLRGFIFVADDGEAWEAASGFKDHQVGDRVTRSGREWRGRLRWIRVPEAVYQSTA